jgi:hypothetical protein
MAKVSIGLRGWRFEEDEVFTETGEFRPLDEIPEDPRRRLLRLPTLVERPCDACYLVHGDDNIRRCREPTVVYGEPMAEAVVCDQHEVDFLYWFREAGGREYVGSEEFGDAFHEWFAEGGRAPEGYAGLDHVDTDPDHLPEPPDQQEVQRRLEATSHRIPNAEKIDIRALAKRSMPDPDVGDDGAPDADGADGSSADDADDDGEDDEPLDEAALADLDQDYPRR